MIEGGGPGENVALALEAPSLDDVTDPMGRTFRAFADQTRSDRLALAACLRGSRGLMTKEEAAGIGVPVLIAVGTTDEVAGSAQRAGDASFRARKCLISRAATTCARSATRSTRPACWISCHGENRASSTSTSSSSPKNRAAASSDMLHWLNLVSHLAAVDFR